MQSIRQSRGRIAFEVLCTLTVAASCVAAWMQTYATAFLPAAVATGLYGLWHLTDMRVPKSVADSPELPVEHLVPAEPEPVVTLKPAKPVEAPKAKKQSRKKKAPVEEAFVVPEIAQPEAPAAIEPETFEPQAVEAQALEPEVPADFPDRTAIEEELHAPIAPLFETKPVPFQQRPTFGRRGRLGL